MCVSSVCAVCVRLCACTRVCVCHVRAVYFSLVYFLVHVRFYPFLMCVYELTSCAFTFVQVVTSLSCSFHFFCLYICMCLLYLLFFLSFFSVYTPLTSYSIYISYVLNMFGFFFFFYILCSLCMCIISRIALVPHGRGLDVKRQRVLSITVVK